MKRYAAAIISGGKATRMGFDKQLIFIGNILLRDYQIARLQLLFDELLVVTNSPELYDDSVICVSDCLPYSCPLTGIYSALYNTKCDGVFAIACDMPIIDLKLISDMLGLIKSSKHDAIIPHHCDYMEPLYAFYDAACLPSMEKFLVSGGKKIRDYLNTINIIRHSVTKADTFINLNELSDLEKLEVKNGIIVQKEN